MDYVSGIFIKDFAEKGFCRCGGSWKCRAERRPPLRYGRRERSEHDRSEARPSCSEDISSLPTEQHKNSFSSEVIS